MSAGAGNADYQAMRAFLKTLEAPEKTVSRIMSEAVNAELTARQRLMVEMYYLRQMRMTDIAEELEVNVSTVSRTLQRGRTRLVRCLAYSGKLYMRGLLDEE